MYDPSTAALIRATPALPELDRQSLPDRFSRCFVEIAAARLRLRAGDATPEQLTETLKFARRLAQTNEALVALSPEKENRRSAAFVAATAHQLVYQVCSLSSQSAPQTKLSTNAVSADVAAMLLFLIAQASADAAEVANRIQMNQSSRLERELTRTLIDLTQGQIGRIVERKLLSSTAAVRGSGADRASDALYYMILKAVRALAFRLRGRRIRGMADPVAVFRKVKNLASPRGSLEDDLLGLAPVAVFPGPFHLASLLVAIGEALLEDAVVNVVPPSSVDPARWQRSMQAIAKDRPYLWANHQDAIKKGCLEPGVSSVISFPTGAGKSIVSELKIRATLLAGRKAVCLAPTHALVDQTARDLRAAFPSSSVQGERADEFGFSREADDLPDILVMTPEACLLLIHMEASAFENVGLLVFDEYQLIHPSTDVDRRSIDAMLCIINFIRVAPNADLVLLSAMVKNTDEIVAWITELTGRSALELSMAWKPTRQMRGCVVYDQSRINKLNNKLRAAKETATTRNVPVEIKRQMTAQPFGFFSVQQTWASQKRQDYAYLPFYASPLQLATNSNWRLTPNAGVVAAALATAAAEADIKTLIFSQSIPNAVSNAKKAACAIEACEVDLTEHEKRWFAIAVDELGGADQLYIDVHEGKLVSQAASHHGQLLPEERYLVESLYKRPGGVKVLAATPTLGQGVNLPSELVIIAEDSRFRTI